MEGRFVGYVRVSTAKQGESGLGLEAQERAIRDFLNGGRWELLDTFVEVESGRKNNRPELRKALERCRLTGATLLIAKLDRLSRNAAFIVNLMESGVKFRAVDMPEVSELVVHILAAVAQAECRAISLRTREALKAAKARGTRIGNPNGLTPEAMEKGREVAHAARSSSADAFARRVYPTVDGYRREGLSLNEIARRLNSSRVLTASGREGRWTPTAVKNLVARIEG